MEPLTLKQRQPEESPDVEAWDDDDFDNLDDVQFRTASTATSVVSHPQTGHRDSISRMSMRSDSNQGDENWDVLVDEQAPIKDAIALAKSKGIPLPSNVPRSALEGGTIRRLKGKEIKKVIAEDWSEDIDIAPSSAPLRLAKHEERDLSESLRQISAAFRSSPKSPEVEDANQTIKSPKSRIIATPVSLDAFADTADDDFGDIPTIRIAKHRSPQKPTLFTPTSMATPAVESIEEDLELPTDGQLRLSTQKAVPRTPHQPDDFDFEWGEGSLGFKNAGKSRGGCSARSSSASALSPSVSSAFTAESEDDGLDGLVLPEGPVKFEEKLRKRQSELAKALLAAPTSAPQLPKDKDDFFDDLDMGDGDVFNSSKLTLNRNVKHKTQRPTSPSKRATTTLNFTSTKSQTTISRLPRFQASHERARSNLEPVSETGAAVSRFQRPSSRLGLHSAQSSVSSIPTPTTPTPSTPSRRGLRNAESRAEMRYEAPTTTNAQLLRAKRSMPAMRAVNSPTKPAPYVRPPSRQEAGSRLNTPHDRSDSRQSEARKPAVPFLPAGAALGQSQHVSLKGQTQPPTRHYRRQDSDGSGESMSAAQRSLSRLAGLGRPETPRGKGGMSAAELAAQAKKQITKPARRRNYGDGSELEIFDDLPTSASTETKFTKVPIGRGAPRSLRSKLGLSQFNTSTTSLTSTIRAGSETPLPSTPLSPPKQDFPTTVTTIATANIPRFARDTAASRIAREQRHLSTTFQNIHGEPLQPIPANFKMSAAPRSNANSLRKKKNVQQKPHLIKPMGNDLNKPKTENGMHYNPLLYRWEGNENALVPFDVPPPDFYPREPSPLGQDASAQSRGSPTGGKERNVALISQIGNVSGVQVVGGMVFDPRQMRWLKMAESNHPSSRGGSGSVGDVEIEEEEDVFAGLEDLKEEDEKSHRSSAVNKKVGAQQYGLGIETAPRRKTSLDSTGSGEGEASNSSDEYGGTGVAEEFDVGPEFIRRQKMEEERWRRKVEKWLRRQGEEESVEDAHGRGGWRWGIREMVMGDLGSRREGTSMVAS